MKAIFPTLLLILVSALCACSKDSSKIQTSEVDAWLKANPKAQIVDVRKPQELASGHLPNAVRLTWSDESTADFDSTAKSQLDSEKPILVYCRSGRRSALATKQLQKLGFSRIRDLDGGFTAWKKAGKPVNKPK